MADLLNPSPTRFYEKNALSGLSGLERVEKVKSLILEAMKKRKNTTAYYLSLEMGLSATAVHVAIKSENNGAISEALRQLQAEGVIKITASGRTFLIDLLTTPPGNDGVVPVKNEEAPKEFATPFLGMAATLAYFKHEPIRTDRKVFPDGFKKEYWIFKSSPEVDRLRSEYLAGRLEVAPYAFVLEEIRLKRMAKTGL